MKSFMKWLANLPMSLLLVVAILAAVAPVVPEPHLWEKLKMLAAGELSQPVDIFDLVFHATPLALLVLKLVADRQQTKE